MVTDNFLKKRDFLMKQHDKAKYHVMSLFTESTKGKISLFIMSILISIKTHLIEHEVKSDYSLKQGFDSATCFLLLPEIKMTNN